MDLAPHWRVRHTKHFFFYYISHAHGFVLSSLSLKYKFSSWGQFQRCERHTHLKRRFTVESCSQNILFPYTTEQKQVVECSLVVLTCEIAWSYTETSEFAFSVFLYCRVGSTSINDCSPQWLLGMRVEVCAYCLNCLLRYWRPSTSRSIFNVASIIKVINPSEDCRTSKQIFSHFVWKLPLTIVIKLVLM